VRARIAGTGSYAPERVLTNADLERMVDLSGKGIVERTGVRERYFVMHQTSNCGGSA
jgi:3-oxoacyl-[acyl-carrier-protein] synthase-3